MKNKKHLTLLIIFCFIDCTNSLDKQMKQNKKYTKKIKKNPLITVEKKTYHNYKTSYGHIDIRLDKIYELNNGLNLFYKKDLETLFYNSKEGYHKYLGILLQLELSDNTNYIPRDLINIINEYMYGLNIDIMKNINDVIENNGMMILIDIKIKKKPYLKKLPIDNSYVLVINNLYDILKYNNIAEDKYFEILEIRNLEFTNLVYQSRPILKHKSYDKILKNTKFLKNFDLSKFKLHYQFEKLSQSLYLYEFHRSIRSKYGQDVIFLHNLEYNSLLPLFESISLRRRFRPYYLVETNINAPAYFDLENIKFNNQFNKNVYAKNYITYSYYNKQFFLADIIYADENFEINKVKRTKHIQNISIFNNFKYDKKKTFLRKFLYSNKKMRKLVKYIKPIDRFFLK